MRQIATMTERREYYAGRCAGGRRELHIVTGYLGAARVVSVELVVPGAEVVSRRSVRHDRLAPLRAALEHTAITPQPVAMGTAQAHPGVAVRVSSWCTRHAHTISRYVDASGAPLGWALELRDPEALDALGLAIADLDAETAAAPPVVAPRTTTSTADGMPQRPARNRGWEPRRFSSLHSTSNPKRKAQS